MPRRHLPDEVQILGVTVAVKLASRKELDSVAGPKTYACWVVDSRTVYVLRSLSWERKVEMLMHELEHAFTDYKSWLKDELLRG